MSTKNTPADQPVRSFIETARRAQIISAAIGTIAELGYGQASLAQIGKRAGISKGVITYYFASKEDLMREVAADVLTAFAAFVIPRMEGKPTVAAELRAFFEANAAFLTAQRPACLALLEIASALHPSDAGLAMLPRITSADISALEALLLRGQEQGEFRDFDRRVMAVSILALRNSMVEQAAADPDLDLAAYVNEVVTLVALATRSVT